MLRHHAFEAAITKNDNRFCLRYMYDPCQVAHGAPPRQPAATAQNKQRSEGSDGYGRLERREFSSRPGSRCFRISRPALFVFVPRAFHSLAMLLSLLLAMRVLLAPVLLASLRSLRFTSLLSSVYVRLPLFPPLLCRGIFRLPPTCPLPAPSVRWKTDQHVTHI